ncbi:hypothetical protein KO533_06130 [Shewanella sp. NKUCC05_KAH]|uniref:hypothetical protein n=1 Tax=Shewanella TaxID=22 RepID=UPI001C5AAFDA|nr:MULTISPECIES: hypothetical protein [unclassified Shewanella]MBW3526149.1 hypothetical protein [Shewanella sp. NKUCC05_KAH]MCU8038507.1 hypothetical protein [Shewanella sp. SM69]
MKVPSIINNDELEILYEKLGDDVMNLPQSFKKLRLGLLPRICQLFITSMKFNPNKKIKFFQFESSKETAVKELLDSPHSLTALLMSDNVYEKDDIEDGQKIAVELKSKINLDIQSRLNKSIYRTGQCVQLFAVDHSIKKYAYPSCFYTSEGNNALRQSQFYTNLLNRIIELTPTTQTTVCEEHIKDLGQILYELIENTEQHAKHEINTGRTNKSVRGLVIEYKLISKEQESASIGGTNSAITQYLEGIRSFNRTVHILEISIFDSGEGIFKSLSSENKFDISIEDEVKVVENSFSKGTTSKADSQGYGRGLFNVRSILNKQKGFISLRTGRIGVYHDFNLHPVIESEKESLSLYDEVSKLNKNYHKQASVEGLACSILVPLR